MTRCNAFKMNEALHLLKVSHKEVAARNGVCTNTEFDSGERDKARKKLVVLMVNGVISPVKFNNAENKCWAKRGANGNLSHTFS